MEEPRVITPAENTDEKAFDYTLRPKTLTEFIGQQELKENLEILMAAAKSRLESIEHVLLYGNPGLGKTTLAHIIANEMSAAIRTTSGPSMDQAGS